MSRYPDVEGWILVAIAAGMGLLAAWLANSHLLSENMAKASTYTVIIFASLVMALRPAWHRRRLWLDLGISLVLHSIVILSLLKFLDAHSVRLNWALALPFAAVEMLVLLSQLWRRNVSDSSP
jgi:hypothetical protein